MTKAEEKRAAIVAKQAARELAEQATQQASGVPRFNGRKRRTGWPATPLSARPTSGRPPKT
jgi:hypothetical protein